MTWPTATSNPAVPTANVDSPTDVPASARDDLNTALARINALETLLNSVINFGEPALKSVALPDPVAVAYAATLNIDVSVNQQFMVGTLTGSTTLNLTGTPVNGRPLMFRFKQDATGTRSVTLPAGSLVAGLVNTLANKVTWLTLIYVTSDARFEGYWSALP